MDQDISKVKCFGEKCALTAEVGISSKKLTCINLEFAPRVAQSQPAQAGGHFQHYKSYAWSNKKIFQLDLEDMNLIAGVLLGFKQSYYLQRDDKELSISRQKEQAPKYKAGIFIKAGDGLFLLVSPGGAIELCQLLLRTIESVSRCAPSYVLASIKGGCSLE